MEFNKELLRYLLLIGAAPVWVPFLRTLWKDFNEALREEGGLFGSLPSPREQEEIRREKAGKPDTLVSEPWVRSGEQRAPRMRSPSAAPRPTAGGSPPATGRRPGGEKRGFR
jgi:hypothetical protein